MAESNSMRGWRPGSLISAVIFIVAMIALWQIRIILLLTLASVIVVIAFSTPLRFLTRRLGLGRLPAIIVSIVGFIVVLVVLSLLVFPTLITQFTVLTTDIIPRGISEFIDLWNSGYFYEQVPFLQSVLENIQINSDLINQFIGQVSSALGQLGGSVLPLVGDVANAVLSIVIVIFLSLFLLAEPQRYERGIIRLFPLWYRPRIHQIMARMVDTIQAWLRVTGVSMLVAGVGTGLGLALLGINQWAALGVLTGILSFIPNFGPIISLIPAISVGIVQIPESIGLIIIVVFGVSFVQSQIVAPLLANENMNLPPVLVLLGQIIFGIFFGFLGLMLAVPLTAITMVLVDEVYIKDMLGDEGAVELPQSAVEVEQQQAADGISPRLEVQS